MQLFPEPANATRCGTGAERTHLAGGGPRGVGARGRGRSTVSDSAVARAGSPKQEDEHWKQEANSRDLFHGTDIHTFCLLVHKKAADARTNIRWLQSHSHYRQLLEPLSTGHTDKERTGTMACPPGRERLPRNLGYC
jgi:hypothetical protein